MPLCKHPFIVSNKMLGLMSSFCVLRVLAISCTLYLIIPTVQSKATTSNVTCETEKGQIGRNSSVKCYFGSNLQITRKSFSVVRFAVGDQKENNVVIGTWKDQDPNPICWTAEGFRLASSVTDQLVVAITPVKEEHLGHFACQVIPPEPDRFTQICTLSVEYDIQTTEGPSTPVNDRDSRQRCFQQGTSDAILALQIILLLMNVTAIAVCAYFFITVRRNRFDRTWLGKYSPECGSEFKPLFKSHRKAENGVLTNGSPSSNDVGFGASEASATDVPRRCVGSTSTDGECGSGNFLENHVRPPEDAPNDAWKESGNALDIETSCRQGYLTCNGHAASVHKLHQE